MSANTRFPRFRSTLKRMVEDNFGYVRVRGEISGFKGRHSSGHCYFALKDDRARLEAIIWGTTLPRLRFKPAEGIEVIASGKLTTFPGRRNTRSSSRRWSPRASAR